ncbi:MAG: hypothetical protein PUI29_01135 [Aeromonadales bacterium]|nr:hypothetical protein [Aeromonadales bacterium]MDY2891639.1 hypothetical protein [Succinivibrio sp.]
MTRECLNQRIPGIEVLRKKLKAWNEAYEKEPTKINWQFTNEASRIKLSSLYPDIVQHRQMRDERRKEKSEGQ